MKILVMNARRLSHNLPLIPMTMKLIALGHDVTYFAHKEVLPILEPLRLLRCKVMVYELTFSDYTFRYLTDCNSLLPELLEYFKYVS
jgi:UDP:flavonoid glycosyltransferase YjiC (YdhE family)